MRVLFCLLMLCFNFAQAQTYPNPIVSPPSGATYARTVGQHFTDTINVLDFGAKCDGLTDDTSSIKSAFAAAQSESGYHLMRFPSGTCLINPSISTPGVTIIGGNWDISGNGQSTTIKAIGDGDIIRIDISTYSSNSSRIHDLRFISSLGAGNQTNTNAVRFYCSNPGLNQGANGACQGATYWDFQNLYASGVYRLVKFDETCYTQFSGSYQIQNYGHFHFLNLNSDSATGVIPNEVVRFDAGPGAHNSYIGGTWASNYAGLSINSGTLTGGSGMGDQLITGIHFINSQYGIYINGPTNLSFYRTNWSIVGNQFDGITTYTVYAANLNYFRLDENNSTLSVGYLLPNTQPSSIKDRYQGNGNFGIAQISVPSGTNAVDVFDVIRSPNNGSGLYSAVHVQCFITALIGNVGDAEIVGDFIVEFQGTSTTTVRQVNNITYGPGASYMSLVLASYSTDRARATLTITSSPSTNTFNTYVDIDGISYQFSPVTGS